MKTTTPLRRTYTAFLQIQPDVGVTITQIAKQADLPANIVGKHMSELGRRGVVEIRRHVGGKTLWSTGESK